jgi:excinuclease ABC subunit C
MGADWLEEKLEALPAGPGVYLMKDRQGEVIYVGKALSLRARVRSYFGRTSDTRAFVPILEGLLGDVETVVVSNEKEALLLENELIKRHQPRFNVLLKDDKNYICLRLDHSQAYPRLEVVRHFEADGAQYFGPYSSASSIRETLRIVNRYFQLRTCTDHVLANRRRPCLLHQIGRCPAPCVHPVPAEEYHRNVAEVALFLEGKASELTTSLKHRMKSSAKELRFEEAAHVRDQLFAIERSLERQTAISNEPVDQDVFSFHREADRFLAYVLYVRQGRLIGGQAFPFSGQEFPDEELLLSFVNLYYAQGNFVPDEVLLPSVPEGEGEALADLLGDRRGRKVRVLLPRRGERARLLDMARANAAQAFQEQRRSQKETEGVLERLTDVLGLRRLPRKIECFDISHFQGSAVVGSAVAMTDGQLDKARYRRFRVKLTQGQDDYASIHEVVSRRLRRGLAESDLPDLLVIDGGKGQLAAAHAAMRDEGVTSLDVVGLAKARELEVSGREAPVVRSPERVFVLGRKDAVVLRQNAPELFLLTRLRDEAHRFAIGYQQKLMRRRNFQSVLEDISGVGAGRRRALLRHFGSLKRVRAASLEELARVEGVSVGLAARIHAGLHAPSAGASPEEAAGTEDTVWRASLEDASAAASEDQERPVDSK